MRITGQMSNNSLIRNLQRHEQGLDEVQNQIGTGIKIQRPSDDPGIATNTIYFRSSQLCTRSLFSSGQPTGRYDLDDTSRRDVSRDGEKVVGQKVKSSGKV